MQRIFLWLQGKSLQTTLKTTYFSLMVVMGIPTLALMVALAATTSYYSASIGNITMASRLGEALETELASELWDIVMEKKSLEEGSYRLLLNEIHADLDMLEGAQTDSAQWKTIWAAKRAVDTAENYIEQLEREIELSYPSTYRESTYRKINSSLGLGAEMLEDYVSLETTYIEQYNEDLRLITMWVIVGVCGLLSLGVCLAIHAYRSVQEAVYKPIHHLETMAEQVAAGDLQARAEIPTLKELQTLAESFNTMNERLEEMIAQRISDREMVQKAQMRTLQAQITPHFIYNTFDTIVWLAEQQEHEQVIDITMALTNFLRISLSSGQDFITVQQEIAHVQSYLAIQSVRYGSIMSYEIDVDPAINQSATLKLLLQPLVENAIYHGVKLKRGRGKIQVRGYLEGADMVFSVSDDGMGMTTERLESLTKALAQPTPTKGTGYGVYNVNKRLRLYYNSALCIESEAGKGTVVSFRVPLQYNHEGGLV